MTAEWRWEALAQTFEALLILLGFKVSHIWIWELDHKECWEPNNWGFWIVGLEKTLESPLAWKEIKQVSPKENQSWIFIGRTDAEAEIPILWPSNTMNWFIGEAPDWRQEEKGMTEDDDGWMALPTQWTWVWARSGSWWWTGRPAVLQSMGSQRVGYDWVTELN